ncbi:MAG: hypothetical protein IRZ16_10940 [Myxococcaceae bacterium]|nr:hypothetical protein [Myxococcaceae bacterium]
MRTLRIALFALPLLFAPSVFAQPAAGITWTAPSSWKKGEPRPMRAATYVIPAQKGDPEDAELGVFAFGPGQGGSVEMNIQRWIGQFQQPDGGPSDKVAHVAHLKVHKMAVTTLDLSGTYVTSMGPPMMGGQKVHKENFRILGAIVEGPEGAVFFKLVGPKKTVAAQKKAFDRLIQSIQKTQP